MQFFLYNYVIVAGFVHGHCSQEGRVNTGSE